MATGGALTLALLAGCDDNFDPVSRITDFRLLAVQADQSFAAPGEQVRLQTLFHEPFGRPVVFGWATCTAPADTTVTACLQKRLEEVAASGEELLTVIEPGLSEYSVTIPVDLWEQVAEGARKNTTVGVITVACPGELGYADPTTLKLGELPFVCRDANTGLELGYERYALSVKRIFIRDVDRNIDPLITNVLWDGVSWPADQVQQAIPCSNDSNNFENCKDGQKYKIKVEVPPESFESGVDQYGTPYDEQVIVQYYATEGAFEFEVRTADIGETQWVARQSATGQLLTFWFVVRDDRGGVTWTTRQVQVLTP